jgi:D-alanine-D-alanine ligase
MSSSILDDRGGELRLRVLEKALVDRAGDLAVFLVFDRPSLIAERPALALTFYEERCETEAQLERLSEAFRSVGAYVELFENEPPFLKALAEGRLLDLGRDLLVAYNGMGWGVGGGFRPGRKALIPLVADSYDLVCANSDGYACAIGMHKFHCFRLLEALGLGVPPVWQYRPGTGWVDGCPPEGMKVIVKSTYEAWSVGVTEESVFRVDNSCEERASLIAEGIGQPVTVQEFIPGPEVGVTVLSCPEVVVPPPMESILTKAPEDPNAVMTVADNMTEGAVDFRRFEAEPGVMRQLRASASKVLELLQLEGFTRMDFRVDDSGVPWLTDVSVSPGLEPDGSAAGSFAEYGFDHGEFIRAVVASTLGARGLLKA